MCSVNYFRPFVVTFLVAISQFLFTSPAMAISSAELWWQEAEDLRRNENRDPWAEVNREIQVPGGFKITFSHGFGSEALRSPWHKGTYSNVPNREYIGKRIIKIERIVRPAYDPAADDSWKPAGPHWRPNLPSLRYDEREIAAQVEAVIAQSFTGWIRGDGQTVLRPEDPRDRESLFDDRLTWYVDGAISIDAFKKFRTRLTRALGCQAAMDR
jgi:hypothetical protein